MKRLILFLWMILGVSALGINITNYPSTNAFDGSMTFLLSKASAATNFNIRADLIASTNWAISTFDPSGSATAVTNGYPWTNIPASSVAASNVTSGGVLIAGTVAATPMTAGYALGTDGSTRIWTNNLNGVSIGGSSGSSTYVTTGTLTNHVNIANVDTPGAIVTNGNVGAVTFSNTLTIEGNATLKGTYTVVGTNAASAGFGALQLQQRGDGAALYIKDTKNNASLFLNASTEGGAKYPYMGTLTAHPVFFVTGNAYRWGVSAAGGVSFGQHAYNVDAGLNNVIIEGTLTPTNGVVQMIKPSFTTNFTCTTNLQVYLCNGTNQVVTLPNAAYVPNVIYRFASTNGRGSFTITNATGAQTIRDGTSLSFNQIGIGSPSFFSDGAQWWPAARTRVVMPTAQFSCSTNIPLTLANTAYPVTFNSIDFNNSQGIALVLGTNGTHFSRMWITNSGQYQFAPSIVQSYNGNDTIRFWFRSSNTNIPNSCTPSKGQNGSIRVITVPFVVNVTAPTDFEIWAESDSTGEELLAQAASGNYPAAPSIICPIWRISDPWP